LTELYSICLALGRTDLWSCSHWLQFANVIDDILSSFVDYSRILKRYPLDNFFILEWNWGDLTFNYEECSEGLEIAHVDDTTCPQVDIQNEIMWQCIGLKEMLDNIEEIKPRHIYWNQVRYLMNMQPQCIVCRCSNNLLLKCNFLQK
jgi:hypothetical protein